MSFQSNWGYQENCNEYGKRLHYVKETDETELNYEFLTTFNVDFSLIGNTVGNSLFKIISDFENESVYILKQYINQNVPCCMLSVVLNRKELLLLSNTNYISQNSRDICRILKSKIGLDIEIEELTSDYYENYRNEIIADYCHKLLLQNDWLICGCFPEKSQRCYCKSLNRNNTTMNVISIQNVLLNSKGKF